MDQSPLSLQAQRRLKESVPMFLQRTARLDELLATLAGKLNSNEAFNPDRGFQVDVVFAAMPAITAPRVWSTQRTQSWSTVSGSREQEKEMYYYHQK